MDTIRQRHNLNHRIDWHRLLVLAVGTLWLTSWTMLVLEPCCEWIAHHLPHLHVTGSASNGTGGHHEGTHCQPFDAPTGEPLLLAGALVPKLNFGSAPEVSPDTLGRAPYWTQGQHRPGHAGTASLPPLITSGQKTYLTSQRLRI